MNVKHRKFRSDNEWVYTVKLGEGSFEIWNKKR